MNFLNAAQIACAQRYDEGEFADLKGSESQATFNANLKGCDDTLLQFLMIELSSSEGCDGTNAAISRIEKAISQLQAVHQALEQLPDEEWGTAQPCDGDAIAINVNTGSEKSVKVLRETGHSVLIFSPQELGTTPVNLFENRIIDLAWEVITDLKGFDGNGMEKTGKTEF